MTETIRTNRHWREFLYGYELPASVRPDFDYLDDDEFTSAAFIKYRGEYMALDNFMLCDREGWQGVATDSYFSGTLIRISDDGERYQVARIYS